jgi:hypothetical protein
MALVRRAPPQQTDVDVRTGWGREVEVDVAAGTAGQPTAAGGEAKATAPARLGLLRAALNPVPARRGHHLGKWASRPPEAGRTGAFL